MPLLSRSHWRESLKIFLYTPTPQHPILDLGFGIWDLGFNNPENPDLIWDFGFNNPENPDLIWDWGIVCGSQFQKKHSPL